MTRINTTRERATAVLVASPFVGLPTPVIEGAVPPSPNATLVYDPDLTQPQADAVNGLLKVANGGALMSPADYAALANFLATGRSFLGLSQADFIALTQNARDRMLFDNVSALWRVIFRLLRDT